MPQLTIYMDKGTLSDIKKAAKADKTSVSKWARTHLADKAKKKTWSPEFRALFGSAAGTNFRNASREIPEIDEPRAKLL